MARPIRIRVKTALEALQEDIREAMRNPARRPLTPELVERILEFSVDPRVIAKALECRNECPLDDEECLWACLERKTDESLRLYGPEYGLSLPEQR